MFVGQFVMSSRKQRNLIPLCLKEVHRGPNCDTNHHKNSDVILGKGFFLLLWIDPPFSSHSESPHIGELRRFWRFSGVFFGIFNFGRFWLFMDSLMFFAILAIFSKFVIIAKHYMWWCRFDEWKVLLWFSMSLHSILPLNRKYIYQQYFLMCGDINKMQPTTEPHKIWDVHDMF